MHKTNVQLVIVSLCLLGIYFYTVTDYLVSSPSEGFSREVELDTVDLGYIKSVHSHILSFAVTEKLGGIIAVDGKKVKALTFDSKGNIDKNIAFDLNLFNAKHMMGYALNEHRFALFYLDKELCYAELDLNSGKWESQVLDSDILSFQGKKNCLIEEKEDGLYYCQFVGEGNTFSFTKERIYKGEVLSYATTSSDEESSDELQLLIKSLDNKKERTSFLSLSKEDEGLLVRRQVIEEDLEGPYLDQIKDISVDKDTVTALYLYKSKQFNYNYLTVQQFSKQTGDIKDTFKVHFKIFKSRFQIEKVNGHEVSVILQDDLFGSTNLERVVIKGEDRFKAEPLTKTKKLSLISEYFQLGEDQVLIFADIVGKTKKIQLASTNQQLVDETTAFKTVHPLRIVTIAFVVLMQSLFTGVTVYLLIVALVPAVIVALLHIGIKAYQGKVYIQNAVGACIHTGIKLYFTYYQIHQLGNYHFHPKIIGEEPMIFGILVVSSLISYGIMGDYIRRNKEYESTAVNSYLIFILAEFIQYTLLIFMYTSTYLVINQI